MIPRIIHLCWLSGDPYPEPIKKCIESMYEKLPNYEIKIWTRENFDLDSVQWVREAFEAKKYAYAADYIRFWTLYNYGGIYLDSDVEVLKTFDDFLNHKSFFGFEYINIPEAAVMGAEKDVAWIKRCLDWYDGKSFFEKDEGLCCIGWKCLLWMGFATSLDAFAAGVSLKLTNSSIVFSALIIGAGSFLMSGFGFWLGYFFKKLPAKYLEILGGLILIFLAVKTLL